jgi:hypothetical protein
VEVVAAMIRISLRGAQKFRTGTMALNAERHELASWHLAADGVVIATTDQGVQITMSSDGRGGGTLTMPGRVWSLSGITRDGDVMTGEAVEEKPTVLVSDAEMAAMFPGCGFDA